MLHLRLPIIVKSNAGISVWNSELPLKCGRWQIPSESGRTNSRCHHSCITNARGQSTVTPIGTSLRLQKGSTQTKMKSPFSFRYHSSAHALVRTDGTFSSTIAVRRLRASETSVPYVATVEGEARVSEDDRNADAEKVKSQLLESLTGLNRGIFGVPSEKKARIDDLLCQLESLNPLEKPTDNLHLVDGDWLLLYSSISILGQKRTKLGLREFVKLGEFRQTIDTKQSRAVNRIDFHVAALSLLRGALTVEAIYKVVSKQRVAIKFEKSAIVPDQLLTLFNKNYDLLLAIFNPEGWLDITYVDATMRIGRDNKGNVFLLERVVSLI
eukprot:TRINITY_DN19234_c0_g1_i1.p1 TRINITY_DN19234_c0_g1~~TRINITY_DN19234_c0_g1_i1.p1  ORF type:complete len:326 (+),score=23.60 TRINITY_DN19234_c0_g1_i1:246-1223(+)